VQHILRREAPQVMRHIEPVPGGQFGKDMEATYG